MAVNFSTDLHGQVAIVTGASAGLGAHFARILAACGAKVALVARRPEKLDAVIAEIRSAGGEAYPFPADLSDSDSLETLVQNITDALGTVTILVNNAGIPDAKLATKMSLDLIDQVVSVNLKAPFILSREVAKRLIEAGKPGRIVNLSSMAAYSYDGKAASSLYSITKAAISRMTEVLAVEWVKYNINVNAIAPGAFHSEMMDGMIARIGDPSERYNRMRLGEANQLDSSLLFFLSPSSDFVTGTIVKCDDGQSPR